MMRLANGIVLEKDATFGELKFSALRREVRIQNEDGTVSDEIKERTYDLKSKGQGRMIQVSIPASVPLKEFDYNVRVELTNPIADTVATATYMGADVDWYIKADDIVLTKDSNSSRNHLQPKKEPISEK
ncbi:TPA: YdcP family protein [Streptococcus suis]